MGRFLVYLSTLFIFLVSCTNAPLEAEQAPAEKNLPEQSPAPQQNPDRNEPSPYGDNTSFDSIRIKGKAPQSNTKASTVEVISPPSTANATTAQQAIPTCSINFYPDNVPTGGGTVMVWKMENAISGSYNCRNQWIKGEVTALYGQIKIEKTPKSLFCSFTAFGTNNKSTRCTATLISQPISDKLPHCTATFSPAEVTYSGKTIFSWSAVNAQRVFYSCPDLKMNSEVRENFGSRVMDKMQKSLDCEVTLVGENNSQSKCKASLTVLAK